MKKNLIHLLTIMLFCPFLALISMAGHVSVAYAHPTSAVAFNCPNHCYGQVQENPSGGQKFWGGTTAIDAKILSYNNPSNPGFITNEMWFADDSDSNCTQFGDCWIEVGYDYSTANGSSVQSMGTHAFWADVRPNNIACFPGCGYNEHNTGTFSLSSSDVGKKMTVRVSLYLHAGLWQVSASLPSGKSFTAYSTNNYMPGSNDISLGEELYGSGFTGINAIAPLVYFSSNRYQGSIGGSWNYFTSNGSSDVWNPPWASWATSPSSSPSGSSWHVCIGYSAC